jgi:hypothetical protein
MLPAGAYVIIQFLIERRHVAGDPLAFELRMCFVWLEIELQNLARLRGCVCRRNLRVEQGPFGNLNGSIHQLGVVRFLDLVSIDDQSPAIRGDRLRQRRFGFLQHLGLDDLSVDSGTSGNPCLGQLEFARCLIGTNEPAINGNTIQKAFPWPVATDFVSENQ